MNLWNPTVGGATKKAASSRGPRGKPTINRAKSTRLTAKSMMCKAPDRLKPVVWPASFFRELQKRINLCWDYGPLCAADASSKRPDIAARYQEFAEMTAAINKLCGTSVPIDAAINMRAPLLISRGIKAHVEMLKDINDITARYLAGENIVELSKEKGYPPVGVFRRVLLHRGMSEAAVKTIVGKLPDKFASLSRHISARDIEQLKEVWNADATNPITVAARAHAAAEAEAEFVAWFRTQKVNIKTQEQLVEEQMAEFGRAVATPDVLILSDYFVGDVQIYWIDFKDYIGCPLPFILRGCQEQAARYTQKWGRGAFCFHGGYVEGTTIDLGQELLGKNPLVLSYI